MVLNCKTHHFDDHSLFTVFEAPNVLSRIFFSIGMVGRVDKTFSVHVSFCDPQFVNYVCLTDMQFRFELKGPGLSQGKIFAQMISSTTGEISAIEILE